MHKHLLVSVLVWAAQQNMGSAQRPETSGPKRADAATVTATTRKVITTFAGTDFVFPRQPLPAVNAPTGWIWGIALNKASGDLYFSDHDNCIVAKVNQAGTLTVVAGNGVLGHSGDGGPATAATLIYPQGIAFDPNGNLFIADNSYIRKVTPSGIITTVAGNPAGNSPGDGGPATNAILLAPSAVAVDASGNIFIAGPDNRIRKVTPGGIIGTIAGDGTQGFSGDGGLAVNARLFDPNGVLVDNAGNLLFADSGNNRIREVALNGIITTIAGGGSSTKDGVPATSASIPFPTGIALDATGNLFVTDQASNVHKITPAGTISTVAGSGSFGYSGDGGPATSAALMLPQALAVDGAGNLSIADTFSRRIRKVTADGTISTLAGGGPFRFGGDGGAAASAYLNSPKGGVFDAAGNFYFSDSLNNRIRMVSKAGIISTVAGNGSFGFSGDGGPAIDASLAINYGDVAGDYSVQVDAAGNLYFSDTSNGRIRKVAPGGIISTFAGGGYLVASDAGLPATSVFLTPKGLALDSAGNLFISEWFTVSRVSPAGIITSFAGNGNSGFSGDGGQAINAGLDPIEGQALDPRSGDLFLATGNRVRKITSAGIITTVVGDGCYCSKGDGGPAVNASTVPNGIAVDASGNLYIGENGGSIRMVTPAGIITTVAGGRSGFFGDGGDALAAALGYFPAGVTVDAAGNLFIADSENNRIREVLATPLSFTITPASVNVPATAGTGTVSVTATPSVATWTAISNVSWITITSGASGTGNGTVAYSMAANSGAARTGTLTIAEQTFTVMQAGSGAVSIFPAGVGPAGGSGVSAIFTFTFTDLRGFQDLGVLNILVNNFLDGRRACYLAYSQPSNVLYLVDDAGDGGGPFAGSAALNAAGTIQNSQCVVSWGSSPVAGSGNTLTLTLTVGFTASFGGSKVIYLAAGDVAGTNSGWQPMGVWQVPGGVPATTTAVVGMNPASGSGLGPAAFAFSFSDTMGFQDLGVVNILVNDFLDGRHACYLAYALSYNVLYLMNDNGDALLAGQPLSSGGTTSNSQCTVSWSNTPASGNGNSLTLALSIGFNSGFVGNRVFYLAARDVNEANNTGWQAMGSWMMQ